MSVNKKLITIFLLFGLVFIPLLLIASLFFSDVQKYLIQTQLKPWIKDTQVEYIHITPFTIKINKLHFKYHAIDINIGHLDTEFSPFKLFSRRIKIDKFILNNTTINDQSIAIEPKNRAQLLFPGIFPYLNTGYIYDIGELEVNLQYQSSGTGPLSLQASASNINEQQSQALNIHILAPELSAIPDIKKADLKASIFLNQHLIKAINRQNSTVNLQLETDAGLKQDISLELAMEQLPKPDIWDAYPFDKQGNHYLTEILHPEKIILEVHHSEGDNLLSELLFNGIYDGNEGIISGTLELLTEKGFLALFKSLQLPEIESDLTAKLSYNTRTLDGFIQLKDQFKIRHYLENHHSLPDELTIDNYLNLKLDDNFMQVNHFLLNILSQDKEYITLSSYRPLLVNLKNIQALLDQQQSDLFSIKINRLPLKWFNDFIPGQKFENGLIDTDINLSVAQRSLLLKTRRPLSLKNLTLIQEKRIQEKPVQEKLIQKESAQKKPVLTNNKKTQAEKTTELKTIAAKVLLDNQFIETDFNIHISDKNLSAVLERLEMFQLTQNKAHKLAQNKLAQKISTAPLSADNAGKRTKQLSTSLQFNVEAPVSDNLLNQPLSLSAKGQAYIDELIKIPLLKQTLQAMFAQPFSESLPKQLKLNFQLALKGRNKLWTLDKINILLNAHNHPEILALSNMQSIQLQQQGDQFKLQTKDKLASLKIRQFNFNWLEPVINRYAAPYKISGQLTTMNTTISHKANDNFDINIQQLDFSGLKLQDKKQLLFDQLGLKFNSQINYSPDKISIHYPQLALSRGSSKLLSNKGSVILSQLDKAEPHIYLKGTLNGQIHQLMKLKLINQFTHKTIRQPSLLDAQYQLTLFNQQINLAELVLSVFHPRSKGRLDIKTLSPVKISLKDSKQNFSHNGQLRLNLTNFDIAPYEVLFPKMPITFDRASARINLVQKNRKQSIKFVKPLRLRNVHYKNPKKALLKPFNIVLDMQAIQSGRYTNARVKNLTVQFIGQNNKALDLHANLKFHSGKSMPIINLNAKLKVLLTQWLNQPGIMPANTLTQGTLTADIALDKTHQLKHKWLINDLSDGTKQQLIKSIQINGSGEIKTLKDLFLKFPLVMQSQSGTTELTLKNHIQIIKGKPAINIDLQGKEIFLNDLLKLLAAINPESELSKLEQEKIQAEQTEKSPETKTPVSRPDNTPAKVPFWPGGTNILANLDINKLYYSDYMSYHDIKGQLKITTEHLIADNFQIRFHKSPMTLNADLKFTPGRKQPYNIKLDTSLSHFNLGGFLKELNPKHVPRADGVFDVKILFYGPLSNLTQIGNELMFNIDISGIDGVYHLIPADDIMARSGGQAMAVVGEVVSVLPTSGFGLGIINRVVRFAKDINYDLIRLTMSRQADLNSHIDIFEILSPELHLIADGQITFKPNTRLMDQDLGMQANLNLSGEGAAIFYGLGLLKDEQDEYGFWNGPTIKFWGSINNMQDNFDEIINKAKEGTLLGGITNPFSGLVGNFKYRWSGTKPDYSQLLKQYKKPASEAQQQN